MCRALQCSQYVGYLPTWLQSMAATSLGLPFVTHDKVIMHKSREVRVGDINVLRILELLDRISRR